jgi:DNA invertase Pin-like site-specific DNA recombinase
MKRKKPTQAAIYIRVSSPDQVDNFSLEAQEEAARQHVKAQGWRVHQVYADEGYSARTDDRPAFRMMLRDAKLRQFNVIVVHKLDRFYRNLGQLLGCVQQLDERDVRLVSISEDIDFSSASGRMLLTSIGMIGEFYSNNLREETAKGKRQRALNGLWNSCIPFGYQQGRCTICVDPSHKGPCPNAGDGGICPRQTMIPHPRDSIGVLSAFELHAQGKTYQQVADFLNAHGYQPSQREHPRYADKFGKETVRSMLKNETYLGFVKYRGELYPGQHSPLISRDLFERSQQVRRDAIAVRQRPAQKRTYLLSGLIRCAGCDYVMRGATSHTGIRNYRDSARERGEDCSQHRVKAKEVEARVGEALSGLNLPEHWRERIALLAQATPEVEQIERQRRMLRSRQRRLKKLFLKGDLREKQYDRHQRQLKQQIAGLKANLARTDGLARRLARDLERLWILLKPPERKRIIQAIVKTVYIKGKEVMRIDYHRPFATLPRT